jgi:hypothetical protein
LNYRRREKTTAALLSCHLLLEKKSTSQEANSFLITLGREKLGEDFEVNLID